MRSTAVECAAEPFEAPLACPVYLEEVYWWAYLHPRAVELFEREWLVNTILFGNYARLRDAALYTLAATDGLVHGSTLQVACVYGNLTERLHARLAPGASLTVVDILPIQLENLRAKMPGDARVTMLQRDAGALGLASRSCDNVLLFFLLHEQPEPVRRATIAEALRVVRPGGQIVIIDYHRPARWHPLRALMWLVFRRLEPYALDLWQREIEGFLPAVPAPVSLHKTTWFGGLYQRLVIRV